MAQHQIIPLISYNLQEPSNVCFNKNGHMLYMSKIEVSKSHLIGDLIKSA